MSIRAISNFLKSSLVPKQSTFALLNPKNLSRTQKIKTKDPLDSKTLTNEDFIKLEFTVQHIESILRRCDHDGDTELNYEEYLEIIYGIQNNHLSKTE